MVFDFEAVDFFNLKHRNLNASMILSGMGPVDPLVGLPAKLFASFYTLFSGIAFVDVTSFVVAPFSHSLLHRLHLDDE